MRSESLALALIVFLSTTAMAADLPKEGSFEGTAYSFGTYRLSPVGTDKLFVAYDEDGLSLGSGPFDHLTWHCWGTTEFTSGIGQGQGYCVGMDPDGDRMSITTGPDEKHTPSQRSCGPARSACPSDAVRISMPDKSASNRARGL